MPKASPRKRKRSPSPPVDANGASKNNKDSKDQQPEIGGGGESLSLSVSESNKLRISLGLAPLDDGKPADGAEEEEEKFHADGSKILKDTDTGREYVHRPALSQTDKNKQSKVKDKLEAVKMKRQFNERTAKVTLLSARETEADNASEWVDRMREKEETKRLADERERALADMDEEFGVSAVIEGDKEKATKTTTKKKGGKSGSKHNVGALAGMNVEHSADALLDAEQTILVLKDKDVLDDCEETLVNPTMVEMEQWSRNTAKRGKNKKSGLALYEEEVDEWGKVQEHKLLGKYDEDEDGSYMKSTFRLDDGGNVNLADDKQRQMIRDKLRLAQEVSLESKGYTLASEYYTAEEMDTFKKKKKVKRQSRKRKGMTADDLLDDQAAEIKTETKKDRGSRRRHRGEEEEDGETKMEVNEEDDSRAPPVKSSKFKAMPGIVTVDKSKMRIAAESDDDSSDASVDDLDWNAVIDDEAEDELQSQLNRTRRLAQAQDALKMEVEGDDTKRMTGAARVNMMLADIKDEPADEGEEAMHTNVGGNSDNVIVLNSVAEYARNLGDAALAEEHERQEKLAAESLARANKTDSEGEEEEQEMVVVRSREKRRRGGEHSTRSSKRDEKRSTAKGRWVEEGEKEKKDNVKKEEASDSEDEEMTTILGKEANLSIGIASALQLARDKGYLTNEGSVKPGCSSMIGLDKDPKMKAIASKRHQQVNESHDIDDKYRKKMDSLGMRGGPSRPFEEKEGYNPSVQIAYVDDMGRKLDQKEAWQQLCWKFHGRNPSKGQIEKKLRKKEQNQAMTQMNPLDTPLGSVVKQKERQERLQQPYLVLSGKGSGIDLTKESYPEPTKPPRRHKKYKK